MTDTHDTQNSQPVLRILLIAVILAAAWLVWSGLFKPLLLGLGLLSVILTVFVLRRMGYFSNETFAFRYSPRLVFFWAWLGKEIVISSLQVIRVVLMRRIEIEPEIITLDVSDMEAVDQALLGNSITLTPGTLALDVHEGLMQVHCLTKQGADGLREGEMQRRVKELRQS